LERFVLAKHWRSMPELAQSLQRGRPVSALAYLGAAALAATFIFSGNAAGAAQSGDLPPIQAVTEVDFADDAVADSLTDAPASRVIVASRSDARVGISALEGAEGDLLSDTYYAAAYEVADFADAGFDGAFDGEFHPVLVTPAPIFCRFTGLTHLAETHELCSNPANNTPEQNQALGQYLTAQRGWVGDQWQCMDSLMTRESRWRHNADNPVSAARGIPQKMMSVHYGAEWRTSPTAAAWMADPEAQIEWGLDYIQRRYQTPCGAWSFFQNNGWY
jgi:hypothetical protein